MRFLRDFSKRDSSVGGRGAKGLWALMYMGAFHNVAPAVLLYNRKNIHFKEKVEYEN